MHPSWREILDPLKPQLRDVTELLKGKEFLPPAHQVLRIFEYPMDSFKVLLCGQDPYPTPGHAVGLSFSVSPTTHPLPRGLSNIFKEYCDDLGYPLPSTGDLTPWVERGVFLLNRVLTVKPHKPASHSGWGWEDITEAAVRGLVGRVKPLVSILWGRQAQQLKPVLGAYPAIESAHPSPHTAHLGFFSSRPFSTANKLLEQQGAEPIDWRLP